MSQRERPALRGPATPRPGDPPDAATRSPSWDDLFTLLPPDQRDRLLTLAADRGTIDARLVPVPLPADGRGLLSRLFAGDTPDDLSPPEPAVADDLPADLDPHQRAAAAAALATPDIFLIQGLPGTGKSRVVAAVIAGAARRGWRVLLLAPHPAALDRALELLGDDPAVCPLRCPGRDEALPPVAARCTLAAHTRRLGDQARQQALAQVSAAAERCRRHEADRPVYDRLADAAEQQQRLDARRAELADQRARALGEAEAAMAESPAAADHAAALDRLDADRQSRRDAADHARHSAADLAQSITGLRPLAAARQGGRWWTRAWWKARVAGDIANRLAELEGQQRQAEAEADAAEADADRLDRERADREADYRRDHAERLRAEIDRRTADFGDQAAALEREQAVLADKWQQTVNQLAADGPRPQACAPGHVTEVRSAWERQRDDDRRQCSFTRAWADGIASLAEELPGRLLGAVNLVVATPAGLITDRYFGDPRYGPFDLLLIDEAHELTEGELLAAARRARRWVMIGEPAAPQFAPRESRGAFSAPRDSRVAKWKASAFHRLWHALHCEPWGREDDRLVCRLRPVPPERRGELEKETVADRPDVELRILTSPGGAPRLAEVVFPPGAAIGPAKEYVFQQLGEAPIPAGSAVSCWREAPGHIAFDLLPITGLSVAGLPKPGAQTPATVAVAMLADGVREQVVGRPGGWATCALEFDRAAGWDRERAAAWVRQHVGRHDLGRTARLATPHRMAPALACIVAELLGGDADESTANGDGTVRVEFVPVPPLGDGRRNGHAPPPPRLPPDARGGAGLEIDLSDSRQRTRLPDNLRDALPARGLVNLAEAEAVVRLLARLTVSGVPGPVAVLALNAAQAQLIRRLSQAVPGLPADLVIDVPPALRQREAGTVIVSLTRSHTHRAVFYGDEPGWLPMALARGRERLVLVGDPGTLARRAQWDGPLDHLDAATARRERDLVDHLMRYLHGRGRHARSVRLLEGPPP